MSALLAFYRAVGYPSLRAFFAIAALGSPKIRRGLTMRALDEQNVAPWMRAPQNMRPVWIHCASGEFEYAKPVIRELKLRHPELKILVTYFSPSVEQSVPSFPGVDFACPAPWDEPNVLKRFIEQVKPCALLFARTDVWPETAEQARAHGIPTLLFSATLSAEGGRAAWWARPFTRLALAPLDAIFCVSKADQEAFALLGFGAKTTITGDTRFDQAIERLRCAKPVRAALFAPVPGVETLVAGSTWPEDERPLLEAAARLKGRVRFCFAPHEPTPGHLADLEARALALGLVSIRYSAARDWPAEAIVIVDQVGILAELYAHGRLAFVGGSFRKTVHSVMEPLAAGAIIFVGPKHHNNREALEFKQIIFDAQHAVVECTDSAQLSFEIETALARGLDAGVGQKIREAVAERAEKSRVVAEWVNQKCLSIN